MKSSSQLMKEIKERISSNAFRANFPVDWSKKKVPHSLLFNEKQVQISNTFLARKRLNNEGDDYNEVKKQSVTATKKVILHKEMTTSILLVQDSIIPIPCFKGKQSITGYTLVMRYDGIKFYFGPYEDRYIMLSLINSLQDQIKRIKFPLKNLREGVKRTVERLRDLFKSLFPLATPDISKGQRSGLTLEMMGAKGKYQKLVINNVFLDKRQYEKQMREDEEERQRQDYYDDLQNEQNQYDYYDDLQNEQNQSDYYDDLQNEQDKQDYYDDLQNEQDKQDYYDDLQNEQDKQDYYDDLQNEQDKQDYYDDLQNEQDKQDYYDDLQNEQDKQDYYDDLQNEQDKQDYYDDLQNEQDKQDYYDDLEEQYNLDHEE